MIERRSFLRGLLIGTPAVGQALIQLATPADLATLRRDEEILVGQIGPLDSPERAPLMAMGSDVYIKHPQDGQFFRIGVVTDLQVERPAIDVTTYGSREAEFIPGRLQIDGRFRG